MARPPPRPSRLRPRFATPPPRRSDRIAKAIAKAGGNPDYRHATTATKRPKKIPRQECGICVTKLPITSFPEDITLDCQHDVTTCKRCLANWLESQLETTTFDKVKCPECPRLLTMDDIYFHANEDTYENWEARQRRAIADATPGWRWCLAANCKAGKVHVVDATHGAIFECDDCGAQACVHCDRPAHVGESCLEYRRRVAPHHDGEEHASMQKISETCRKCPNKACDRMIQRDGGCDHMTCKQCGTEFCWRCGRSHDHILVAGHGQGCRHAGVFAPPAAPPVPPPPGPPPRVFSRPQPHQIAQQPPAGLPDNPPQHNGQPPRYGNPGPRAHHIGQEPPAGFQGHQRVYFGQAFNQPPHIGQAPPNGVQFNQHGHIGHAMNQRHQIGQAPSDEVQFNQRGHIGHGPPRGIGGNALEPDESPPPREHVEPLIVRIANALMEIGDRELARFQAVHGGGFDEFVAFHGYEPPPFF